MKITFCSEEGCYREVEDEGLKHPLALLCERHITDAQRVNLKNWKKKQRYKANIKARKVIQKAPDVTPKEVKCCERCAGLEGFINEDTWRKESINNCDNPSCPCHSRSDAGVKVCECKGWHESTMQDDGSMRCDTCKLRRKWRDVKVNPKDFKDMKFEVKVEVSPRIDWCGACEEEHGYDCPFDEDNLLPKPPPTESWAEKVRDGQFDERGFMKGWDRLNDNKKQAVIDFISQLLRTERESYQKELVEKIEGLRKKGPYIGIGNLHEAEVEGTYNMVLYDVLEIIRSLN